MYLSTASIILLLNAITEFNQSVWLQPSYEVTMAIHCEDGESFYLQYTPDHGNFLGKDGEILKVFTRGLVAEEIEEYMTSSIVDYNFLEYQTDLVMDNRFY